MNRALRRAMAKQKPIPAQPKRRPVPPAVDEFEQFDDIERMTQKLEHGAIETQQGRPVMTTKGVTYDVLSALEGWMEYWRMLADKHGIAYDDEPMRVVARRLENAMPLTPSHIEGFKRVVSAQRAMFRSIPRREISSQATTVQIKLLMDDLPLRNQHHI